MPKKLIFFSAILLSLYLAGCAQNDVNNNTASLNQNGNDLSRVKYTPKHGGPAMTTGDISDPGLDVHKNRRNDNIANVGNVTRHSSRQMVVSDQAEYAITAITEVDEANVIVTDNNAFVAVKLHKATDNRLSSKLENIIFREVKSVDQNIDNVYISANPDFFSRMNGYSSDLQNGRKTNGFSDLIRRVFPDAK
jgi:spore cortex protein